MLLHFEGQRNNVCQHWSIASSAIVVEIVVGGFLKIKWIKQLKMGKKIAREMGE